MFSEDRVAIEVNNVGKCYRLFKKSSDHLRQYMPWQRKVLCNEFWALRNVSLKVPRGQTVGVIGQNGSGKSTLLQLICGTLTPTEGKITVNGRVGALLELGSGFNPEFTGIENIRLNAALLGMREKEIDAKMDSILAFAEIGDFINRAVKHYSSGMVVRLAFSVQANIDPSILIVDEALAVGDEFFQKRCFGRLRQLKESGTSILLASHSCAQINQHCDKVLLLNNGRLKAIGKPHKITGIYQSLLGSPKETWDKLIDEHTNSEKACSNVGITNRLEGTSDTKEDNTSIKEDFKPLTRLVYEPNGAVIMDISLLEKGIEVMHLDSGQDFTVRVRINVERDFEYLRVACFIANQSAQRVTGQTYPRKKNDGIKVEAGQRYTVDFSFSGRLWPGLYFVGAGITEERSKGEFIHRIIDDFAFRVMDKEDAYRIGEVDLCRKNPEMSITESPHSI